jgi:hypothetical protein
MVEAAPAGATKARTAAAAPETEVAARIEDRRRFFVSCMRTLSYRFELTL